MYFQSASFGVFLIVFVSLYWLFAGQRKTRYALLTFASYLFYGAYEFWYLALILFSTMLDWHAGNRIHRSDDQRVRKLWLWVSIVGNLSVLCFFKYTDWLIDLAEIGLGWLGLDADLHSFKLAIVPDAFLDSTAMRILVPVGISFYTFQTLSYTIDLYWRKIQPAKDFLEFALFVSFFPQLVAGPIVRASEFLPQLDEKPTIDRERMQWGLYRLGRGLFKKVVLADVIAQYLVDPVYADPTGTSPLMHFICVYGFAFQVYNDFSGYSDCAIGVGHLFGFKLPENFNLPYRSLSVRQYWQRWHISLSYWVRDYMYIPLGGSRVSEWKLRRNLLLCMLTIGIWHGASMRWVIYGTCMGTVMSFEWWLLQMRGGQLFATTPIKKLISWAIVFSYWSFTSLFVRAQTMEDVKGLLGTADMSEPFRVFGWSAWPGWLAVIVSIITHFWPMRIAEFLEKKLLAQPLWFFATLFGILVGTIAYLRMGNVPYVYFAF